MFQNYSLFVYWYSRHLNTVSIFPWVNRSIGWKGKNFFCRRESFANPPLVCESFWAHTAAFLSWSSLLYHMIQTFSIWWIWWGSILCLTWLWLQSLLVECMSWCWTGFPYLHVGPLCLNSAAVSLIPSGRNISCHALKWYDIIFIYC